MVNKELVSLMMPKKDLITETYKIKIKKRVSYRIYIFFTPIYPYEKTLNK